MPSDLESQLVKLAGARAYERGQQYFADGRVAHLAISGDRITATVEGTHLYRVNLQETARGLDGACNCPASEGVDFCKHCVAAALALEAGKQKRQKAAGGSAEDRIRLLLESKPPEALVQMIIDALPELPALHDRLTLQADLASSVLDAKGLKKMLTKAMPLRDVWGYEKAARYFERVEAAVDGIAAIADQISPKLLLATVLHGISRLDKVLERVDDSGGNRWYTQETLRKLHSKALAGLDWPPEKLAEHLLDLTLKDPWDQFSDVLEHYADVLGTDGHEAFLALAQARLDAMPELPFGAEHSEKWPYLHLVHLLWEQAQACGDIDQLIRLRVRTCTGGRDCYHIAELYLQKSDADEAAVWLDKGDEATEPHYRNFELRRDVHMAREDWSAALAAQQVVFEADSTLDEFRVLMEIAEKAGLAESAKTRAVDYLTAQLNAGRWHREICAQTLASLAREAGEMRKAYELIIGHVTNESALLSAAQWFEPDHPEEVCALVARAIEEVIDRKKKSAYRLAVELIHDSRPAFERLGNGAFERFVQDLRQRHKPKRNFIALLNKVQ